MSDLNNSMIRCKEIIKILLKLQKDCARTQDDIENELAGMEAQLRMEIKSKKFRITELDKEIKETKCKWWVALLTIGLGCIKHANARKEMRKV